MLNNQIAIPEMPPIKRPVDKPAAKKVRVPVQVVHKPTRDGRLKKVDPRYRKFY